MATTDSPRFPNDWLDSFSAHLEGVDWERELKRIGALSGSVIGSVVSSRLALSLGMRIVSVVGASYGGLLVAAAAFEAWRYMSTPSDEPPPPRRDHAGR
jgi:hypothetical protein